MTTLLTCQRCWHVHAEGDACVVPKAACTRCPAAINDRAFLLCPACVAAVVAAEAALGDIDTIAVDPFFETQSGWAERVWTRICTTIGGVWPV